MTDMDLVKASDIDRIQRRLSDYKQTCERLEAENRRLKAMLLAIHNTVDGGWPRMDVPTQEYWLLQADNPEWGEWFGGETPKSGWRR